MVAEEIIGIVKEIVEQGGGGGGSVEKITLSDESGTLSNEDWTKLRASDGNILQIKVSDTNIRSFRYATSYGSYVYYVYVSENVDEQAEVEIIAINAGTLVYETRTLALGSGGVQYVDELPTTGSANTLYVLNAGKKARSLIKDRGTGGDARYWKCVPGVSVVYDEDINAYHATMGTENFDIPVGLALVDYLVEFSVFQEVSSTDPWDLVSYGRSVDARYVGDQGLMLSSDLDKDDLPDRTYLRPVEGSNIDIDVNANTLIRDGNFFYDLTFDSGLTNSILFLLRQHLLEVVEDEADAKLVIETNKLTATDGTDCSAISAYGDDVFGGIYLYENGKWNTLLAPYELEFDKYTGKAIMGKVVSRKFDEVKRITYPTEWTANTNTTIDGYIVPEMARHQFEAFMEFFELAKNCLFKCFEGTNMIYLNMVNSYHGNGTEELFFNYPGVGIVKYHRSTMDLDTITTSLIKYNDSPQTISITGTSGSLSDDQYLELQTTDAKILLADEDNIMLDKIKDSGTEFTYSAMIVNTSSALVGYSVVVNEDQSWTRYKKTVS